MKQQLLALLGAGINPMEYFNRDYRKYFYLAECLAMVDLSLMVSW